MQQPLIILITCDELRKDVLSLYGNRAINTEHIDSLAEKGVDFENCYTTSPWCLPARCSILTGLYPHKSGAYSNFRKCPLDGKLDNLFTHLHKSGYETSVFGKCHFAPVPYSKTVPGKTLLYDDFKEYYMSLGIDNLYLQDDKQVSLWFYDDYSKELEGTGKGYLAAYRDENWKRENMSVYNFPAPDEWYHDSVVGKRAVDYINGLQTGGGKPQFVWASFSGPHYPFDAPESYTDKVDGDRLTPRKLKKGELYDESRIHHNSFYGKGNIDGCAKAPGGGCKNYTEEYWNRLITSYNANVKLIDDRVGEILAAAREKYGDNTLIIFTADHGEMLGNHGIWGKHNCAYDEVWHIPLLVKFPYSEKGEKTGALVNLCDIMPTCVAAAGGEIPKCDGEPLLKRIEDKGLKYTFAEGEGFIAVTDGIRKYIKAEHGKYCEYFDRSADENEFENLLDAPEHQKGAAELAGKLIDHIITAVLP